MTTQVETFECSEVSHEPIEACEEAIAIIDTMDLAGQKAMTLRPEDKPMTRCPYRRMTKDEIFAYGVLCPTSVPLKAYSASPIPLRVLQVASHADSLTFFENLFVWDHEDSLVQDPVLVGIHREGTYSWETAPYILARWGSELHNFADLLRQAVAKKRSELVSSLDCVAAGVSAVKAGLLLRNDREIIEAGSAAAITLNIPSSLK